MTGNAVLSTLRFADPGAGDAFPDIHLRALAAEPLIVTGPRDPLVPFIFASPHSGRVYPSSFAKSSRLDAISLRRSEDAFVDELFDSVTELGAPLIAARFPRAFVDANRAPGELDPQMFDAPLGSVAPRSPRVAAGLGVIPRVVRDGLEIYGARLPAGEVDFRLRHFYRPYHAALADLVERAQAVFGVAVVIDCHSMPPPAKGYDIVLGDCYGEAAAPELIGQTQKILTGLGFSVARNAPYAGGYTTHLYGRPRDGVHAIQVEVSRSLYLDDGRMEKSTGFPSCRERLSVFAARLIADAGHWLKSHRPKVPR